MPRKKDVTESMIDIFSDFQDNKKIGRTTLVGVLEESFRSVLAKMFGSDENFDVIVNGVEVNESFIKQKRNDESKCNRVKG